MIVDASAMVDVLLRSAVGLAVEPILLAALEPQAPAVIDVEVGQVLRRLTIAGSLTAAGATAALGLHSEIVRTVHPLRPLMARAWELRDNVTFADALYVATAEATGMPLLTTDERLARAARRHAEVQLVTA